jgi:peptidoglycan/LPS O-acetylase OafA/YrhL
MLTYLSQGAYPLYILHMVYLYLGAYIILPMEIPGIIQFLLILVFTLTGCFVTYEFVIRRIRFLRPLFGLKTVIVQSRPVTEPVLKTA